MFQNFVTICVQNRACIFGHIKNDEMILNNFGKMANKYWKNIPKHFPHVVLDEYIIMPDHVHGIIIQRKMATIEKSIWATIKKFGIDCAWI